VAHERQRTCANECENRAAVTVPAGIAPLPGIAVFVR